MTGALAISAVALAALSGLPGLLLWRRPVLGQRLSAGALCLAAALGIAAAASVLAGGSPFVARVEWHQPHASLALRLDALSALFLVPVLLVPALGSIYGLAYWPQARLGARAVRLQLWYGLVTATMALVLLSDNAMLFLFAWEVMAICGFFLILADPERKDAQKAAWVYLVAAHVGTFAIFAFFSIVGSARGTFDFAGWQHLRSTGPAAAWLWVLALVGFGLKAGLVPLHFWLPGAHAAAPSHVSALMSGVLLKTGVYGILRSTGFFDPPPASWGLALLALGVTSGVLGVAFALAQHDLKRLLAYHSVENIGIITMGAGVALVGRARAEPALVLLGFGGAALHVLNHALFKSLLFLGAGSVQHATGTRDIERLGGLGRAMPWTAGLFLVGAAAISGLPPLNGFVSEWLVVVGSVRALELPAGDRASFAVVAAPALGLVGALAAACFVKVQGTVFLGQPRTAEAMGAHESPRAMLVPMAVLAGACVVVGALPFLFLPALARGAAAWSGLPLSALAGPAAAAGASAAGVSGVALVLLALVGLLLLVRRRLRVETAPRADTWGCGYAYPTARMAYTGSSFAQILNHGFRWVLLPRVRFQPPRGPFPTSARFSTEPREAVLDLTILPWVRSYGLAASRVRALLAGKIHFYALLVLATLVFILAWRLSGGDVILRALFQLGFLLLLPPLLLGVVNRVKSVLAGRRGPPLLQAYSDLVKLLQKKAVYSRTTTWVFRAGPVIGLAAVLTAGTVLPVAGQPAIFSFAGDFVLFAYLLALARFATAMAALDTGSSFEGMGAAREVSFASMAEPALFLCLVVLARATGSLSLSGMLGPGLAPAWGGAAPALLLSAIALFVVALAENSRIPVDDPNTHLELTMIHEVMVLDHSGPDLAFILYGASIKLFLFGALFVRLVLDLRVQGLWAAEVAFVAGMLGFAVLVGVVESAMARLRLTRVPQMLVGASVLSVFALVLLLR